MYNDRVLVSIALCHILVTMEDLEPAERKRSENWNMLTMSLMHSWSLVCKHSPGSRASTVWLILGALHWSLQAFARQEILRDGRTLSLVGGVEGTPNIGDVLDGRNIGKLSQCRILEVPPLGWGLLLLWSWGCCLLWLVVHYIHWWRHVCLWGAWVNLRLQTLPAYGDLVGHLEGCEGVYPGEVFKEYGHQSLHQ